jgi:hypothetical protein
MRGQLSSELLQRALNDGAGTRETIHLGLRFPSTHPARKAGLDLRSSTI